MRVLGLSAFYHDSAAALIEDGAIVAAAQEERFTRRKHDAAFPRHALEFCLRAAGGPPDAVVYYEKPLLKFERILTTAFAEAPRGFRGFAAALPAWLREKLWIPYHVETAFDELRAAGAPHLAGFDTHGKIHFATHHEAHAASAFFPSPFARAAILTLDGVGEWATTTLGRGDGPTLELLRELRFPHSLGLLYSAFTGFCGFRVNSGEYKLMGLAPYGTPRFRQRILDHLLDLRADGSFRLNLDYFAYTRGRRMTNGRFAALCDGPPRAPEAPLTQRECDLARSIQDVTEEIVLRMARTLHADTGEKNLCLAGGVALNCVANGRLRREGPFENLWVQPAAGDAGGALGAALAYTHLVHGTPRPHLSAPPRGQAASPERLRRSAGTCPAAETAGAPVAAHAAETARPRAASPAEAAGRSADLRNGSLDPAARPDHGPADTRDAMRGAFLGPEFSAAEIAAVLAERGIAAERLPTPGAVAERIAARLAAGAIVGVHHGRAEFGPRALGHRSILGDPRSAAMQRVLNLKIKFRESFRPFAPAVLAERTDDYFEACGDSPYMLFTAPVVVARRRPVASPAASAPSQTTVPAGPPPPAPPAAPAESEAIRARLHESRSDIPAVTHVDFSARVQTVARDENPFLHAVIAAFDRLTGCPLVINTSFNVRGEPPVCHPREALDGFLHTGMDALALGPFFLEKSTLDPRHLPVSPRTFAAD